MMQTTPRSESRAQLVTPLEQTILCYIRAALKVGWGKITVSINNGKCVALERTETVAPDELRRLSDCNS